MTFDLKIQNVGKLTDATIEIGNFTVLAGPNNTGKSFVSKAMYSFFDGINENGFVMGMNSLLSPVIDSIFKARSLLDCEWNPTSNGIHELTLMVTNIEKNSIPELFRSHRGNTEEILLELVKFSKNMKDFGKFIEE